MRKSIKTSLIIVALGFLGAVACLIWLGSRPDNSDDPDGLVASSGADASRDPLFAVNIEKPRMDRFLGGILPTKLEAKLFGVGELRFNHASPGARAGSVGLDHLELSADGWDLLIETNSEGAVAPGTRIVFPIEIAEKQWTLRCRPADRPVGYLRTTRRAGSGEINDRIESRFLIELARCEDAKTGKILDTEAGGNPGDAWPASPLTLRGRFVGPAAQPSPEPK